MARGDGEPGDATGLEGVEVMLFTCTTVGAMPGGTKFYLTEYGVTFSPPEDGEWLEVGETDREYPDGTELYVDMTARTVSDVCPPGLICAKLTRDDLINDEFWNPAR